MRLRELIWSMVAVSGTIAAASLLRGFVDGVRAGDPEYYLILGAAILGLVVTVALEKRIRAVSNS